MFAFGELSSLISLLAAELDETAQELTQTQDKLAIANAEIVCLQENGGGCRCKLPLAFAKRLCWRIAKSTGQSKTLSTKLTSQQCFTYSKQRCDK